MIDNLHKVFVYGTLTDPVVRGMVIGPDIDDPELGVPLPGYVVLRDHANSQGSKFPRLVPMDDGCVYGTVITVDDGQLKRLDAYEGEPDFYRRDSLCYGDECVYVYNAVVNGGQE